MDVKHKVEETLRQRMLRHEYTLEEQHEFIAGACAAIQALHPHPDDPDKLSPLIPPYWVIAAMSGRPIIQETDDE